MDKKTILAVLCVALGMMGAACRAGSAAPTAPVTTAPPSASMTPRAASSSTPSPTLTSALEPILAPTATPELPVWPALALPSTFTGAAPTGAVARLGYGVLTIARVSPRGRYIAVGGSMGVTLYETGSNRQVWFGSTPASIDQLEWSPDGWRIAASTDDETIIVWDVTTGARVATIEGDGRLNLDWSPDSTRLAAGPYYDDSPQVWDATTSALLHHIDLLSIADNLPVPGRVYAEFSPDGRFIATTYESMVADVYTLDTRVDIWDAGTGAYLRTLEGYIPSTDGWSWDGQLMPVVDTGGLAMWNVTTGEVTRSPVRGDFSFRTIHLSPGWKWVAASNWREHTLFNAETGDPLPSSDQQGGFAGWSPDGSRYAVFKGSDFESGSLVIRETLTGAELGRIASIDRTVGFSPDWSTFYGWSGREGLAVYGWGEYMTYDSLVAWDVETGNRLGPVVTGTRQVQSLTWSPDGTKLATGSVDLNTAGSTVVIWDAGTGEALDSFSPGVGERTYVAWSPDGSVLAVDNVLWDVERKQSVGAIWTGGTSLTWLPDGTMAVSYEDGSLDVWDVHSGALLRRLEDHTWTVCSGDWSPDGEVTASISEDDQVILWDASTGEQIRTIDIEAPDNTGIRMYDMAFSPDRRLLAVHAIEATKSVEGIGSAYRDVVMVWDVKTGVFLFRLPGSERTTDFIWHIGYYLWGYPSMTWSPDGTKLAAAYPELWPGGPNMVAVWDAATGQLLYEFEGHTSDVPALAFSPDGTRLASGSMDGTVIVWDVGQ